MSFHCIAVDIGASNGRVMDAKIEEGRLKLTEISRFPNSPILVNGELYWDLLRLYQEMLHAFGKQAARGEWGEVSIGLDTFGMDYAILDKKGRLLGNPLSYRGGQGQRGKQLYDREKKESLFWLTGIADQPYNTSYQLYDMTQSKCQKWQAGQTMLFIPDVLSYFLTGNMFCDRSIASPGQLIALEKTDWKQEVLALLEIDREKMPELKECASYRGTVLPEIAQSCGIDPKTRIEFGVHDTAAAIEAIPSEQEQCAFISSGTWSLMGITSNTPKVNAQTEKGLFSNICTLDNRFMILKNIMGLWVLQCCKRDWEQACKKTLTWDEIMEAVQREKSESYIDINDDLFFGDGNMVKRIRDFCEKTGQRLPEKFETAMRISIESLAMSYKETFLELQKLAEREISILHIVGGGARNNLLNQITASVIGCEVLAGPAEATVIGNVLHQAVCRGEIAPNQRKNLIEKSYSVKQFEPKDVSYWQDKWQEYCKVVKSYREGCR